MSLQIDFLVEYEPFKEKHLHFVEELLQFASQKEEVGQAEVSITFVDNDAIQEINREYRNKDMPTDVISFALEETVDDEPVILGLEEETRMLGDIIISVPRAIEQANDYGHSFERELGFLAVHGFLHLLGYDHMTEEEEKVMFSKQEAILHEWGLQRD